MLCGSENIKKHHSFPGLMKLKLNQDKLKPEYKVANSMLKELDSTFIITVLEESIKFREMPITEQFKHKLRK